MTQSPELPRGPFELRANYARNQRLKAVALGLLLLVFGVGMAVYGAYQVEELTRVADIAKRGVTAQGEVGYTGSVRTRKLIFKEYDLEVSFVPDGQTDPITVESEFMRFFTGPEDGSPIGVRYLAGEPSRAVTTWQIEALTQGWIWCLMVLAMGLGGIAGAGAVVWKGFQTIDLVLDLVRSGKLLYLGVEAKNESSPNGQPMLEIVYRLPRGETAKQTFALKDGGPLLDASASQVLVLCSVDERRAHALREDGFPLARRP